MSLLYFIFFDGQKLTSFLSSNKKKRFLNLHFGLYKQKLFYFLYLFQVIKEFIIDIVICWYYK